MKALSIFLLIVLSILNLSDNPSNPSEMEVTFTILYDNYTITDQCIGDWGFSCLIEGKEKTILFDTGTKPDIFRKNLKSLNIDIDKIDLIVISHNHGDHTGGLPVILEKRKDLPLYIPASVENRFLQNYSDFEGRTIPVDESLEICKGVYLTGEMGDMIKEQSLLVETEKGMVIVTGCSHQGVGNVVKKSTQISDEKIYLTFGGFHLLRHSEDAIEDILEVFLCEGVQKCGPTHCTGDEATMMFKEVYGGDFVTMGAGNKIIL